MFDHARATAVYQQPFNVNQQQLCVEYGIPLQQGETCYEVAGRIYNVLLLRAWVYSVFRDWTASTARRYSQLPLDPILALNIAHELNSNGMHESIEQYSTTGGRESDVFYRMSKSAVSDTAYGFTLDRLPVPPQRAERPQRSESPTYEVEINYRIEERSGCFAMIVLALAVLTQCARMIT